MTPVSLGPPSGQFVLSGLNWQFQFAPVTSLMISGSPAPAPEPPPLPAVLPQPAATSAAVESAAASAIVLLRLTTVVLPEHGGWGRQHGDDRFRGSHVLAFTDEF